MSENQCRKLLDQGPYYSDQDPNGFFIDGPGDLTGTGFYASLTQVNAAVRVANAAYAAGQADQQARIAELEAIAERLPKTAGGVVVVPELDDGSDAYSSREAAQQAAEGQEGGG